MRFHDTCATGVARGERTKGQRMTSSPGTVVIAGCTGLGAHMASRLGREGLTVSVVDPDPAALALLAADFPVRRVGGELLDSAVLERAGVASGAVLLATTPSDSLNVVLGVIARRACGAGYALIRVDDPARLSALDGLGVMPVCPTILAADRLRQAISATAAAAVGRAMSGGRMKTLFIVVVGCGRLGSHLANLLSHDGHRVAVVDKDEGAFAKLATELYSGARIAGDASEPSVLRRARVAEADLLITATHEDNVNLMVALVAKRVLGVKNVMARVYDPAREDLYHELGLETVCPTLIAVEAFFKLLRHAIDNGRAPR